MRRKSDLNNLNQRQSEVTTTLARQNWTYVLANEGGSDADDGNHGGTADTDAAGQTMTKYRPQTAEPALYKVILLNDDFTPMDFVVLILKKFFRHSDPEANRIMLEVHNQGAGVAGIYPFEMAETKVFQVNEFSRSQRHPLKCIMEKQDA